MSRSIVLSVFVLGLVAAPAVAAPKPKIAILGLSTDGAADAETVAFAHELTIALRLRAASDDGPFTAVTVHQPELAAIAAAAHCQALLPACLAPTGAELGATYLGYGSVRRLGDHYDIALTLLDTQRRSRVRTLVVSAPLDAANGPGAARLSKPLYPKLVVGKIVTTLVVTTNVMQGDVLVDGVVRGSITNAVARIPGLAPGKYAVSIISGKATARATVTIGDDGEPVPLALPVKRLSTDGRALNPLTIGDAHG